MHLFVRQWLLVLGASLLALAPLTAPAQQEPGGHVVVLTFDGAIGPALAYWIQRSIAQAETDRAHLVVLRMDTPGGLDTAMRDIIQSILDARVPVATYVWPQGARAASAGTYILYASHVAAMAPSTNLGAATPVQIGAPALPTQEPEAERDQMGSTMERKVLNDAVAYIRGLAERNERNADWAERAVREAASLGAAEALAQGVVDVVAADVDDLLAQLQSREVVMPDGVRLLGPEGRAVTYVDMDWRTRALTILTNPSLILILGMIGIYGLVIEFYTPGFGFGGVTGVICLLLAGYGLQLLPLNYAGLGLILLGIALMIGEAMVPSFGVLGFGGVVAFVIGGVLLIDTDLDVFRVSLPLLIAVAVFSAIVIALTSRMFLRIRKSKVVSGIETMLGQVGECMESFSGDGMVKVQGEIWRAHSDMPLQRGERVRVLEVDGLNLKVTKV